VAHSLSSAGRLKTRSKRNHPSRQELRDENARTLLKSIESLVGGGYPLTDITVERMAAHAGISRARFYTYFEDKASVLRAWFDDVSDELTETTRAWFATGPDSTKEQLYAAILQMTTTYRPHVTLIRALYDTALYDRGTREQLGQFLEHQTENLAQHIRDGQRIGFVATGLPAAETARLLVLMAEHMQRTIPADEPADELERHTRTYVDIVWNTLYAR
jgi:TetR/AcrR family transcriptional regulator, ethionamide resistance regulator